MAVTCDDHMPAQNHEELIAQLTLAGEQLPVRHVDFIGELDKALELVAPEATEERDASQQLELLVRGHDRASARRRTR